MNEPPRCMNCGNLLDRIDHVGIEHLILETDPDNLVEGVQAIYRPVGVADGSADGELYGLASETDVRCGYCGHPMPRPVREYFYRRWYQLLELTKRQC